MSTNTKNITSAVIGIIGSIANTLLGGWCYHMTALVILMCIDFFMGIAVAIFWGKSDKSESGGLSSKACWKGLVKKIATLFIVAAAAQLDRLIGVEFTKTAVVIGFCVSEIISLLESAKIMGILPEIVERIFDKGLKSIKSDKGSK